MILRGTIRQPSILAFCNPDATAEGAPFTTPEEIAVAVKAAVPALEEILPLLKAFSIRITALQRTSTSLLTEASSQGQFSISQMLSAENHERYSKFLGSARLNDEIVAVIDGKLVAVEWLLKQARSEQIWSEESAREFGIV